MRLLVNVRACDVIPRGYGFAYHGSYSDTSYCAPIPLNFVIGAWHNFYWYCLVRGLIKSSELMGIQNFWRGKGFSEGYAEGYAEGVRHTLASFDRVALIESISEGPNSPTARRVQAVREADEGRSASDADRPTRRGDAGAPDRTSKGDAQGTDRRDRTDMPRSSGPVSGEVPDVREDGRQLPTRSLDHGNHSLSDSLSHDEDESLGHVTRVDNGFVDENGNIWYE